MEVYKTEIIMEIIVIMRPYQEMVKGIHTHSFPRKRVAKKQLNSATR